MRWTLKRNVINNRAIKFGGQRSSVENECHFAADGRSRASFRSADGQYILLILLTPIADSHLYSQREIVRKIVQLFYFQVYTNTLSMNIDCR